jgi:HPt (histidine-containing phosphotransfer) domain-containing protein
MSAVPPPTPELAELVGLLGLDNVRILVRTFLREYPVLLEQLRNGDRKTRHRVAHSLKSNLRVIGAKELSSQMATFEARLAKPTEPDLTPAEIGEVADALERVATTMRAFAGEE